MLTVVKFKSIRAEADLSDPWVVLPKIKKKVKNLGLANLTNVNTTSRVILP